MPSSTGYMIITEQIPYLNMYLWQINHFKTVITRAKISNCSGIIHWIFRINIINLELKTNLVYPLEIVIRLGKSLSLKRVSPINQTWQPFNIIFSHLFFTFLRKIFFPAYESLETKPLKTVNPFYYATRRSIYYDLAKEVLI